ncbi:hypothetical protein SAMN06296036_10368 [Pseudobacteriovorax antillogorgiicola]|uniref:DUF4177 domain-containing protein n=1 Tax=Pseudobacteriovorax antillogorgiicola TaxID=1513793 RepID=A0A1Y6BBY5_9BACT|nr:hypothetical protein EDD56_103265 [Pseudobacteriovorax antillogorgiicola]SMF00074.1 hypothetical protein SAMN06296036_10368 [Pseudobacteriovorax antillogorgiicola]
MKLIYLISLVFMTSCVTKKSPYRDPPHVEKLPDPAFFHFSKWDYKCLPFKKMNPALWEDALNFYGNKGWELVGFMTHKGQTSAYCLKRKR